jgi:hypothetical protein
MKWRQSQKSIFEKQKKWRNEDVSLLFTLLCQQKLFTQNRRFSSHLHQTPEKTYLLRRSISFRLWSRYAVVACALRYSGSIHIRSTCLSRRNLRSR